MPAANPLFSSWSLKKFRATVFNDIWPEVLFFSAIAASKSSILLTCTSSSSTYLKVVSLVSHFTPHQLTIPTGMLTVLGTVLGLVISFRTSSAYERYQEGRKMWSNITLASRNIAMMVCLFIIYVRSHRINL